MPQKKPVMIKSSRHVDGIKEMIDLVRTQQGGTFVRENTCTDFKLRKRAPLPGIGETGMIATRPRGPEREQPIANTTETDLDPAYGSDEEFDLTNPAVVRSESVLSSKSTHRLDLSHSLDTGNSRNRGTNFGVRRHSLRDSEPPFMSGSKPKGGRTLPPMNANNLRRSGVAVVPYLDLGVGEPDPYERSQNPVDTERPSAPSPSTPSTREDDSLAEDGCPIDFMDLR